MIPLSEKYLIDNDDISLLGFSQGTILSYALCLNYPEKFKNIIGFSGYIDEAMINIASKNKDYSELNLYISHGKDDPVIPINWSRKSTEILKNYKINENSNEISVFFDNQSFNLIGWQTKDVYQNLNITFLSSVKKNENINKNIFKLPSRD